MTLNNQTWQGGSPACTELTLQLNDNVATPSSPENYLWLYLHLYTTYDNQTYLNSRLVYDDLTLLVTMATPPQDQVTGTNMVGISPLS